MFVFRLSIQSGYIVDQHGRVLTQAYGNVLVAGRVTVMNSIRLRREIDRERINQLIWLLATRMNIVLKVLTRSVPKWTVTISVRASLFRFFESIRLITGFVKSNSLKIPYRDQPAMPDICQLLLHDLLKIRPLH